MPNGDEVQQELKPSEKDIIEGGPVRVPEASNTCGIHFPNLNEICKPSLSSRHDPKGKR